MKQTATIKKWLIEKYSYGWILTGNVYGHPRITDGTWVRTSLLMIVNFTTGTAETMNTVYSLGEQS